MLLEYRSEPAETFLYACREPSCFIHYHSSQGYFIEPANGDRSEPEIKPGVHCPKDGRVMNLAEVRPERRSEEHTSELQSQSNLVCRLLLEKKKKRSHQ